MRILVCRTATDEVARDVRVMSSPTGEITLLSVPPNQQLTIELMVEAQGGDDGTVVVLDAAVA